MTPEAAAAAAAELRTIANSLEKARAQLASISELIGNQSATYTDDFLDITSAGRHAFSAAKLCGQTAAKMQAAIEQKEENLL